jgi:hypothetical protein
MILTESDLNKALNQDYQDTLNELVENVDLMLKGNRMLVENHLSKEEHKVLQEGLWEKVKYGLSKLGSYKADGRFFRKKKIKREAAEKMKVALEKASDDRVKNLDNVIREKDPEFPNGIKQEDFLASTEEQTGTTDREKI